MTAWDGEGLVSTDWLAANLNDPKLRIFDATVHLRPAPSGPYKIESGRADYEAGHIPGAGFLDLIRDLSDTTSPLAFTMPSMMRLAEALGAAGIANESRIIVYSTTTPMWATRLWWMLRSGGIHNVAVLDGGFAKWNAEGRPAVTGEETYAPTTLTLVPRPDVWVDKKAVLAAIGDNATCTINALSPGLHSGEATMNYGRKGHIKGSRNVPYAALLNKDGTFRSTDELRALFASSGALDRSRVICYCGGGISATMDALALTRLGHPNIAVYDGSMSEWCADPDLPMESGT
jgi:thiosulfate/3-mercaptopyruvate sulfurtransferase